MKFLNSKITMIIETTIIIVLTILFIVFRCIDESTFFSILISLISLIIAHHSFFLANETIDKQNKFEKLKMQTDCIIELKNAYVSIIVERIERAMEVNGNSKESKTINCNPLLSKIHVLFSEELYDAINTYIEMLFIFNNRNPWADSVKDSTALKSFENCEKYIEESMVRFVNNEDYQSLINKFNDEFKILKNWDKKGL